MGECRSLPRIYALLSLILFRRVREGIRDTPVVHLRENGRMSNSAYTLSRVLSYTLSLCEKENTGHFRCATEKRWENVDLKIKGLFRRIWSLL